ncbi:MAG: hypothetical protein LQ341_006141 [Variospora aurantia]|nr:MAG: hypothetical protein LQ341_006141 [Variospora aurantia]
MKKEVHARDHGQPMDYRCQIPAADLQRFWSEVLRLASRYPAYRQPILVLSGHDLKIGTARTHPDTARRDWLEVLNSLYHLGPTYVVPNSIWVDFGTDEYGVVDQSPGITLINKAPCLDSWVRHFHDPGSRFPRIKKSFFPFAGTRDTGSVSVELLPGNVLREQFGQHYHKDYNHIKEAFSGPFKDILPFCNPSLEAVGCDQAQLNRYPAVNRRGASGYANPEVADGATGMPGDSKPRVVRFFTDTKGRSARALETLMASKQDFGVRHEYRMRLPSLEAVRFIVWDDTFNHLEDMFPRREVSDAGPHDADENAPSVHLRSRPDGSHRRFYILPTKEVAQFIAASINRWLLLIEARAAQCLQGPGQLIPLTGTEQRTHSILIAVLLRTVRLSLGGIEPAAFPRLWLHHWVERKRRTRHPDEDPNERPRKRRYGLDYKGIVTRHGVVSLPEEHFQWEGIPSFTPDFLRQLSVTNGFQSRFRVHLDFAGTMTQQDRIMAAFRGLVGEAARLDAAENTGPNDVPTRLLEVLRKGAELVIQEYIRAVFRTVELRAVSHIRGRDEKRRTWSEYRSRLTAEELDGQEGLSFAMVARLLGPDVIPRIAQARPPRIDSDTSSRRLHFAKYHKSGLWMDRVRALFEWDDMPAGSSDRGWENEGFRKLARNLHYIIHAETERYPNYAGKAEGGLNNALRTYGAQRLYIIPQYDHTRMSVTYKASPNHNPETRANIQDMLPIERMNWWIPRVPLRSERDLRDGTGTSFVRARDPAAMKRIRTSARKANWLTCSNEEHWRIAAITDPKAQLGRSILLRMAQQFAEVDCPDPTDDEEDADASEEDNGSEATVMSDIEMEEAV